MCRQEPKHTNNYSLGVHIFVIFIVVPLPHTTTDRLPARGGAGGRGGRAAAERRAAQTEGGTRLRAGQVSVCLRARVWMSAFIVVVFVRMRACV